MSEEQLQPHEAFGLTEREKLFYRVSEARFQTLIEDERTTIHSLELSANNYGEFVFVTLSLPEQTSQPIGERGSVVTFWGYGFHEYRERWLHQEWFWYRAFSRPELIEQTVDKETAQKLLAQRRREIAPHLDSQPQSERGKWFEMAANITDEDAALADFEDLADWFDE